jgi:WhiB family transcriptional regulator, redox-sensing transcriptional regulator
MRYQVANGGEVGQPPVQAIEGSGDPESRTPLLAHRARKLPGAGWDLIEVLPERPAWHALAACRGMGPQTFFPRTDDRRLASDRRYNFALKYCRTCPVVAECQTAGEAEVFGLWGGLTPTQRAARRARAG